MTGTPPRCNGISFESLGRHGGSTVVTLKALGRDVLPANGSSARDTGVFPPIWTHWKQADAAFEVAYTSKHPYAKLTSKISISSDVGLPTGTASAPMADSRHKVGTRMPEKRWCPEYTCVIGT